MCFLLRSNGVFEKFLKIFYLIYCIIQDYFAIFAVAFVDIITFGSEFFDITDEMS